MIWECLRSMPFGRKPPTPYASAGSGPRLITSIWYVILPPRFTFLVHLALTWKADQGSSLAAAVLTVCTEAGAAAAGVADVRQVAPMSGATSARPPSLASL